MGKSWLLTNFLIIIWVIALNKKLGALGAWNKEDFKLSYVICSKKDTSLVRHKSA